jgi:hypothetical protein
VVIENVPPWLLPDPVVDPTLVEKRKAWSEVNDVVKLIDKYIGRRFYAFFLHYSQMDPRTQIVGRSGAGVFVPEFDVQIF